VVKAIDSVFDSDYPKEAFEVLVVDNNSSDNSRKLIKDKYNFCMDSGKLKLIELESNLGAPAAYNTGIKNAQKSYDYIVKMDNDLILDKNCLTELIKCAESDDSIGIVGGKVFYYSDRQRLHLIGSRLSPFYGGGLGIGKYELDSDRYNRNLELDAVNGCMMLVKRPLIDKIGLMDEKYFLYFDDIDWSLRARKGGFKSVYCCKALAFHNTQEPCKRFQSERWLHYAIYNGFYFMKKNYSIFGRSVFFAALSIRTLNYAIGICLNNDLARQRGLLKTVFNSYSKGMEYLWKKES